MQAKNKIKKSMLLSIQIDYLEFSEWAPFHTRDQGMKENNDLEFIVVMIGGLKTKTKRNPISLFSHILGHVT